MPIQNNPDKSWVQKVSLRFRVPTQPIIEDDETEVTLTGFEKHRSMLQDYGFSRYFAALSQNVDPNIDVRFKAILNDESKYVCRWNIQENIWHVKKPGNDEVKKYNDLNDAFPMSSIDKMTIRICSKSSGHCAIESLNRAKNGVERSARSLGLEPLGQVFSTHTGI